MATLTARGVQALKEPGLYGDGRGLYLEIARGGTKSWILRYQLAGRRRDMGLGSVDLYSLAEARDKALAARRMIADGIDPIEARRASRAAIRAGAATAMTFRQCAERYIAAHQSGWRNPKHRA
jgi:hypothetical protein